MPKGLKIIIPAAGIGKRLRPHTLITPKPLLPVAGKPMLAHILDPLLSLDPAEVIFVVGHLGDQIIDFVNDNYRFKAAFLEQRDLLGLGFAINVALQQIEPGPIMIILSDTIAKTNFAKFVSAGENVIGLKEVDDPRRFGIAITDNGKITAFEEKPREPRSNLAIIGLYYFADSSALKKHVEDIIEIDKRTGGEIQLTDALELMVRDGHVFKPYIVDGWYDCGKVETMLSTNRLLLKEMDHNADFPGAEIIPPVSIAPSAEITGSVIGPFVTISESVKIEGSKIRDSIICRRAIVKNSDLNQSLIGQYATVRNEQGSLNIGQMAEIKDI